MSQFKNPTWWTKETDSAWDRVKAALKRDWDQTKHDFGSKKHPDTDQDVDNTVKQAAGKEPIPPRGAPTYESIEPAHRFGYGAHSKYGSMYRDWNEDLEATLRQDWEGLAPSNKQTWEQDRDAIRYGWQYHANDSRRTAAAPR